MKDCAARGNTPRVDATAPKRIGAGELYKAHAGYVAALLRRFGVRRDDVPDLVQEVFLVAHRKGGFEERGAMPKTWLGAISFRVASGHRRRRTLVLDPDVELHEAANPELSLQAREALTRVERCLASLKLAHRAVFVLFEIEGVGGVEIAKMLEVPVGTVYRRLHEARAQYAKTHAALTRGHDD